MMAAVKLAGRRRLFTPEDTYLCCAGNSFFTGNGVADGGGVSTALRATTYGQRFKGFTNQGLSGQQWSNFLSAAPTSGLSSMLAAGPAVLVATEDTNSVVNGGKSVSQVLDDKAAFYSYCRSVNPGVIIFEIGNIPRGSYIEAPGLATYGNIAGINAALELLVAQTKAGKDSIGVDFFVDARAAGGPFAFTDYSVMPNFNVGTYDGTHPSASVGQPWIVSIVIAALAAVG